MSDLFALADVPRTRLEQMIAGAVSDVAVEPFEYRSGSMPTAGLWRVTVNGRHDYFVKLLRHPRLSPVVQLIPEGFREEFLEYLPWKFELDMHESGIGDILPEGMRLPVLHHVERHSADFVALWWEYVHVERTPWTPDDFARTAYLLGRLAARRRVGAVDNDRLPYDCLRTDLVGALRYYVQGRVLIATVPMLHKPEFWELPVLADVLDDRHLRRDMIALADRVPSILDRLEALPQTFAHGDASPQNLLIPAADRAERVVIDWGFGTPMPIGFDLGQLLVGLAHAGELDPGVFETLAPVIESAYCAGLDAEEYEHDPADVRFGFVGGVAVRSALCALPVESLDTPVTDAQCAMAADRLRLTRALVDMAQSLR